MGKSCKQALQDEGDEQPTEDRHQDSSKPQHLLPW